MKKVIQLNSGETLTSDQFRRRFVNIAYSGLFPSADYLDTIGAAVIEVEPTATEVRSKRDKLLSASDWTQVADAPVDQAAWATYRQALRDIPEQVGFPSDVTWPTEPT